MHQTLVHPQMPCWEFYARQYESHGGGFGIIHPSYDWKNSSKQEFSLLFESEFDHLDRLRWYWNAFGSVRRDTEFEGRDLAKCDELKHRNVATRDLLYSENHPHFIRHFAEIFSQDGALLIGIDHSNSEKDVRPETLSISEAITQAQIVITGWDNLSWVVATCDLDFLGRVALNCSALGGTSYRESLPELSHCFGQNLLDAVQEAFDTHRTQKDPS